MKQKKKLSQDTKVCSKQRQNVRNGINENDNRKRTKGILNSVFKNGKLTKDSNGIESTENFEHMLIINHKKDEERSTELKEHKNTLNISVSDELISHLCETNDDSLNDNNVTERSQETTETDTGGIENLETERSERMPTPGSAQSRGSRTCNLTTIVENVKGEVNELKKSRTNRTSYVQPDKESKNLTNIDKHSRSEIKLNSQERMGTERQIITPPIHIPDIDAEIIKTTRNENNPAATDVQMKHKRNVFSNSELANKPDLEADRRPLSSKSDPGAMSRSSTASRHSSSRTKRINSGIRFTKKELEYYLPRRSNFNCHEKALKDAGLDPDAMDAKRRHRFRRRRIQIEDKEVDERLKEIDEANKIAETDTSQNNEHETNELEDEQSEIERFKSDKTKKKGRKKGEDYDIKVDHTVLLQYLKYVLENQDEYLSHKKQTLHQNTGLLNIDPSCTIARFGRAFQRGQHGTLNESFLLQVVHGIKSNFGDSSHWLPPSKDKQMQTNIKVEPTIHESVVEEKDKTEYEKMKIKLDKWLKTVTAGQLLKAKELSLKELGEEDKLQNQWWSALQPCRYLRQRSSLL